jgi:streptogramin lyase
MNAIGKFDKEENVVQEETVIRQETMKWNKCVVCMDGYADKVWIIQYKTVSMVLTADEYN